MKSRKTDPETFALTVDLTFSHEGVYPRGTQVRPPNLTDNQKEVNVCNERARELTKVGADKYQCMIVNGKPRILNERFFSKRI